MSDEQVLEARAALGFNRLTYKRPKGFLDALISLNKEPMVILLLVASGIYFISGDVGDGFFLASAIVHVSAISSFPEFVTRSANFGRVTNQ